MSLGTYNENRKNRWYFGGLASSCAACVTHPLELLKVLLQTQKERLSMAQLVVKIGRTDGIFGFYSGLSASLARQLTYTMARMGVYEYFKYDIPNNNASHRVALAIGAGICSACVGMVAEVTNVRMQHDMRLHPRDRRNYKHVFDGIGRTIMEDGIKSLYTGITPNIIRGIVMTISTNVVYDQAKSELLELGLKDDICTHMMSSITAACSATTVTHPIDVIKTRMMSADVRDVKSITGVFKSTLKEGPLTFCRGYIPAIMRAIPHTAILFIVMEHLRLYFGRLPHNGKK